ncbi:MAG: DUF2723 domain-containing protein [Elusimicrobia bacterium]|nr:DUF2723 domain-containing protein [Elusimicrobiota bacterium]
MESKYFNKKSGFFAVLFFVFVFYFVNLPPVLAPYRDAGEMALDALTMSISHQPGYPLYSILSRAWISFFPFWDAAYSLNIFSAICGALACAVLFLTVIEFTSFPAAFFFSLLFSLNFTVQTFSSVSEMYSLNLLFAIILIKKALFFLREEKLRERDFFLFSYLCGLFLGNRTDLSLFYIPFLGIFAYSLKKTPSPYKIFIFSFVFFIFGLSVYLYMPIRSCSNPFINWSQPCDFRNFLSVILRKNYGSTLDLISLNYKKGEMFVPNLFFYLKHLLVNFNFSILFIVFGILKSFYCNKKFFLLFFFAFVLTGPVFLYMANMPPNPHALSIVEPYYACADLCLIFFAAYGFNIFSMKFRYLPKILAAISLTAAACLNFPYFYRGDLKITQKYCEDIFSLLPENSIVVVRKDVQLFSLWYYAYGKKIRPDLTIISQGLSGSDWYSKSPIVSGKLSYLPRLSSDKYSWLDLKKTSGRRVFATLDCDLPADIPKKSLGLVWETYSENNSFFPERNFLSLFKKPYNDFFVKDLASSYALGICEVFSQALKEKKVDQDLLKNIEKAFYLDGEIPDPYVLRGFYFFSKGKWRESVSDFEKADLIYSNLLKKAKNYAALPEVLNDIKESYADALMSLGAAYERIGLFKKSETAYLKSLELNPNSSQVNYNLAVLYWNSDKLQAKNYLKQALLIDPNNKAAAYYLKILDSK